LAKLTTDELLALNDTGDEEFAIAAMFED